MKSISNKMNCCKVDTRTQVSGHIVIIVNMIDEKALLKIMELCIKIRKKMSNKC